MTRGNIKEILLLYRPGTADAEDPQIAEAIELSRHDPELGRWFGQHQRFQAAIRAKLRQIEPPKHLKFALLACPTPHIRCDALLVSGIYAAPERRVQGRDRSALP